MCTLRQSLEYVVLNLVVYVLNHLYVRRRLLQETGSVELINNGDSFRSTLVTS
jgi:hypothetical protein